MPLEVVPCKWLICRDLPHRYAWMWQVFFGRGVVLRDRHVIGDRLHTASPFFEVALCLGEVFVPDPVHCLNGVFRDFQGVARRHAPEPVRGALLDVRNTGGFFCGAEHSPERGDMVGGVAPVVWRLHP